ncbi:hypothetical protein PAN31117_05242 [Pandoraea anapnoica]|uniref:Uncharacterized protein n=1 Tax=Pandoraea anapnoica TaxID=2508301 RepID=A0A5E5APV9_9BURK|nr:MULTISPECIES: hypothetical protein [Pandoraea]VVE59291.1 hypothetical protein PIN31009_05486 [Pandoraea iniqua]VVE75759.1 hypothetical protein PAN31117_05242 [Pandoraea anapnoica]
MLAKLLCELIYSARNPVRIVAKIYAWCTGVQLGILYILASIADAPLTTLLHPALRALTALAILFLVPRLFDAALKFLYEHA